MARKRKDSAHDRTVERGGLQGFKQEGLDLKISNLQESLWRLTMV